MSTATPDRGLPSLAGIGTMSRAQGPGLSVEECVRRLKRIHFVLKRLALIFTCRITAEPRYELKMAFSYHAHLCAEIATTLRKRVSEMREPPLGLDEVPDGSLEILMDEILCAPETPQLLLGLYGVAIPEVVSALQKYSSDTNPLADHPSLRLCRHALLDLQEVVEFGGRAIAAVMGAGDPKRNEAWQKLLAECLATAGGVTGPAPANSKPVARMHSAKPYQFQGVPARDERFPDPYNMGVNAEVFLYDPQFPPAPKTLMMFYKRLREIDVPEMMASIIAETPGKPWDYYRDMIRQLWDEARHAMMGEVGFASMGLDWSKVMINFTWSLALNTQLKPIERHAVLYFIEQGLMSKTGKRFEWEVGLASGNPLAGLFQDFDWADEVLHARIGRDWYLKEFDDPKKAVAYGDECWSKVLMGWSEWKRQGLTEHRNWWPELYKEACAKWGIEPDPKILAYDTSYETVRADLKNLQGSA